MRHLSSASGGGETPAVLSRMGVGDGEPVRSQGDLGQASLVFPVRPLLSSLCVPFSLPHEGNPKRDALMAKIRAMVTKGAVIPFPEIQVRGFIATFSW